MLQDEVPIISRHVDLIDQEFCLKRNELNPHVKFENNVSLEDTIDPFLARRKLPRDASRDINAFNELLAKKHLRPISALGSTR